MSIEELMKQGVTAGTAHRLGLDALTGQAAQSAAKLVGRPRPRGKKREVTKVSAAEQLERELTAQWSAQVEAESKRQKSQQTPPPPSALVTR